MIVAAAPMFKYVSPILIKFVQVEENS